MELRLSPVSAGLRCGVLFTALVALLTLGAMPSIGARTPGAEGELELVHLGTYSSGVFGRSASEVVAHDPLLQRLFVVNAANESVDVLSIADPTAPARIAGIDLSPDGGRVTSVAVNKGLVAIVQEGVPRQSPGVLHLFAAGLVRVAKLAVGSVPDMVTFTPDGSTILVANEGEPHTYCNPGLANDPEGSVSLVDVRSALRGEAAMRTAGFGHFSNVPDGVRIFGPNATVAQDLEPEFIAVSDDGTTAWITLQENNALAVLDVQTATVTELLPLGVKDHLAPGMALDASNHDGEVRIASWPVFGMYQPDGLAAFNAHGDTWLAMANEGEKREWPCYVEDRRGSALAIDPSHHSFDAFRDDTRLGRLQFSRASGDLDGDGLIDRPHAFGARSFSIRSADGTLVWDSGDDFERVTADAYPAFFNVDNVGYAFDKRSDNRGPEPEGIVVGNVAGRTVVFVALERIGGVMVYDVTNPRAPSFIQYVNPRDFSQPQNEQDLGPEGLAFIPASESPICEPIVVVANEVSGTTTLYAVRSQAVLRFCV